MDRYNLCLFFQYIWGCLSYVQISQQEENNEHVIFAIFVYFLLENL